MCVILSMNVAHFFISKKLMSVYKSSKNRKQAIGYVFFMEYNLKLSYIVCFYQFFFYLWTSVCFHAQMDAFYHELIDNKKAPSQALRLAKEHMKQYEINGCTPYSSPFYWAGYIIIGDRFIT